MRETVELYGIKLTKSKIKIFYVTISNPTIIFPSFSARFCLPTSTTSQLQIASMCTNNGLILELKQNTSEIASFYSDLLKCFNCSLVSAFGEEEEYLFIGGWAPLQFNNIRILIERKENYQIFIKAIQHFNNVLDGEESDDFDYNEAYRGAATSYLSRISSQTSELTNIDSDGVDCASISIENENEYRYHHRRQQALINADDDNKIEHHHGILLINYVKVF